MSLQKFKKPSLKDKLTKKEVLEKELTKVDDEIDAITGEKKVKISKKKSK